MKIRKFNLVGNPSQSPFTKGRGFTSPPLEKGVPKAGDFIFGGNYIKNSYTRRATSTKQSLLRKHLIEAQDVAALPLGAGMEGRWVLFNFKGYSGGCVLFAHPLADSFHDRVNAFLNKSPEDSN